LCDKPRAEFVGLPGCVASGDCVNVFWDAWPAPLQTRCKGKEKYPTLVFVEVVSSHTKTILSVLGVQYGTDDDKTNLRSNAAILRICKDGDILKESSFKHHLADGSEAEEKGLCNQHLDQLNSSFHDKADDMTVYWNAYNNLCDCPNHVLRGIICNIDKLVMDRHIIFLLAAIGMHTKSNIGLMSKAESTQHTMKSLAKIHLHHDNLSQIIRSLVELQGKEGGLPCQFNYRGKVYNVLLLFPLLLLLSLVIHQKS
jgi:hypothetical protein